MYVDNAGNFLIKGNTYNANYIKVTADGGIAINSNDFSLKTSGEIGLGATSYSAGDGVWLANAASTKFRVGKAGSSRMQWNDTDLAIYNSTNALVASFGATNSLAGWSIATDQLSKSSLVLNASATPYIALGATSFLLGDGVWLATAASTKFRVGKAGSSRMQWDDTDLQFYNSLNENVVSIGTTNKIAGFTISPNSLSSSGTDYGCELHNGQSLISGFISFTNNYGYSKLTNTELEMNYTEGAEFDQTYAYLGAYANPKLEIRKVDHWGDSHFSVECWSQEIVTVKISGLPDSVLSASAGQLYYDPSTKNVKINL
jgi:hypothetical protein